MNEERQVVIMEQARTYTNEKSLAEVVVEKLRELKMNKAELALHINYSRSMVSQYLNGKYTSDATGLEEKLRGWLIEADEYLYGKAQPEAINAISNKGVRKKIEYFESKDYVNTIGVCTACQENMGLGIIVGKSGYGKTHSLKKYSKLPRVVYVECNETMNCKDIVRKIEREIGIPRTYGSIDERLEHIIEFFNINQGYLLIVDEADKLITKYTQKKIEILRYIADGADVGIVIAGEPCLESAIKAYDNRFANRMDFYYKLKGLTKAEVEAYFEGYDVEDAAMSELAVRACNSQSGCFRLLDRTLNNVIRILKENGDTKITMNVINQASNMMML